MVPAETVELLYRSELAHRAIRLSAIPLDHSVIIGHLRYELSQSTDAYLLARTNIHMAVTDLLTLGTKVTEVYIQEDMH